MRLAYFRVVNGAPRRVLSMTPRALGPAGTAHEGDMPGPKEFFQAAAFLSEAERPTVQPLSEQDLTPELIAEKAAKYNVLPEDYYPLSMKTPSNSFGDYPVTVGETYNNKAATYEWDDFRQRKNYGDPIGINQIRDYGPFAYVNDAHYHPYGFWQYYEYWRKYLWQHVFSAVVVCCVMLRVNELNSYLVNGEDNGGSESYVYNGKFWYNKHWSHTELEFREVFNKMQQAKQGFPGYSETHELHRCQDTTAYFMGAPGTTAGRDRHGPTGTSPLRREPQETYMPPAGPMAFKHLAYQTWTPRTVSQDHAGDFAASVHPHAGHCTYSSHYKLATEVVEQADDEEMKALLEWIITTVYAALSVTLFVGLIILSQSYLQLRHTNSQLDHFEFDKLNAQIDDKYAYLSAKYVQCSEEAREVRLIEAQADQVEMKLNDYVDISDKVIIIKQKLIAMREKLSNT